MHRHFKATQARYVTVDSVNEHPIDFVWKTPFISKYTYME